MLSVKPLKDRADFLVNESNVHGIQKILELANKGEDAFRQGVAGLKPIKTNYNSTAERTITRIVTGAVPAFYLANDAFNLSMYMNDDKEVAKSEKSRRFKQEVTRIAVTAGATFGVLGLFAKKSNESAKISALLISSVTLVSEVIGRMIAGNPVLPVSTKTAKAYAEKQGKLDDEDEIKSEKPERISNEYFKGRAQTPKAFNKFEGDSIFEYSKPPEKGVLTFENIVKAASALAALGFGVEKIKGIKSVKKFTKDFGIKYNSLFTSDYKIKKSDFESLLNKLRFIQRVVRIAYGAFLIKLFNGMFSNTYNSTLLGAQAVNVGSTSIIEFMERKSVGLPIGESNRDAINKIEKNNLRATGLKGAYFRLMAKLTGKKTFYEMKFN